MPEPSRETLLSLVADALPRPDHPEAVLARLARPGRVRDTGIRLLGAALRREVGAGLVLRRAFRADRILGSRDRRAVADLVYDVLRWRSLLQVEPDCEDAAALWDRALVRLWGLPHESLPGPERPVPGGALEVLDAWSRRARPAAGELLARATGLPPWWTERLVERGAASLAPALCRPAPVDLRANRHRVQRDALLARLAAEGVQGEPGPWAPGAIRLHGRPAVPTLPAFREGLLEIQDAGSQLVAELAVPPRPDGRMVDFCAGAGGKSLAVASRPGVRFRILGLDVRRSALRTARDRARRAGLTGLHFRHLGEGAALPRRARGAARVLVDAPCTGSGTLRRRPDHRSALLPERIAAAARRQRAILARAAELVAPGGWLVYATCSLLDEENREVVAAFLGARSEFERVPLAGRVPLPPGAITPEGDLLLRPDLHGTDGFYAAVLRRRPGTR